MAQGFTVCHAPNTTYVHFGSASKRVQFISLLPSGKRIQPLDLSICEYSQKINIVSPQSVRRFLLEKNSKLIDALALEPGFVRVYPHEPSSDDEYDNFPEVYLANLEDDIVNMLRNSRDQVNDLKRYLKAVGITKLCRATLKTSVYRCFLEIIIENCPEDSDLVLKVIEVCGNFLVVCILQDEDQRLLKFILWHAQKTKTELFGPGTHIICPLASSILYRHLRNIKTLLAYGYSPKSYLEHCGALLYLFIPYRYDLSSGHLTFREGRDRSRLLLLVQLLHLHTYSQADPDSFSAAVRLIWRSIPDRYLDEHELETAFRYASNERRAEHEQQLRGAFAFYKRAIGEREVGGQFRSLAQRCRCVVRDAIGRNRALPQGIEVLDLPERLKSYLRLEC